MEKKFKIPTENIKEILPNRGGCYASDMITVEGEKVRYMYRENPDDKYDSGWRFFSGKETQEYTDNPDNFGFYKLNTIANYDQTIVQYLDMPVGTTLELNESTKLFEEIE